MESGPNTPPTPDLYFYGKKYSELLDRLSVVRMKFVQERKDDNINASEMHDAIQNFETERIEKILSKLGSPNLPWHGHSKDSVDSSFFDSTGDTFIDTENKTIYRAENTSYYEDAPTQVEVGRFYSLDPLGKIQVAADSNSEDIDDDLEPELNPYLQEIEIDADDDIEISSSVELDLNHAKSLIEMLESIIASLEEEYANPDWYVMPHSINETSSHNNKKYFVIEKAQKDE
jgi:hypothetical protein